MTDATVQPAVPSATLPSPVRPRPGRRVLSLVAVVVPTLAVLVIILAVWTFVSMAVLRPDRRFLLPPPHDVVREGLLDHDARAQMLPALWSTTQVMLLGLAIAFVLGVVSAIVMSQAKWLERSLYPWAVVLQTIPVLALVPLIGFWWGYDTPSRVTICVMIAIFPIITNTLFGLKAAETAFHDLFSLSRASRFDRLVKLELPSAVPGMVTGLRISAGLSVIGAIVGDLFFRQGPAGIGRLLDVYRAQLDSERMFAALALSCTLGIAVFWAFGVVGHLATRSWRTTGVREA